jgi:hypothetical protein
VVVVRGAPEVAEPVAERWAQEHRSEFDVEMSVDLVPWRRPGGVDFHALIPHLLQSLRGWAWPLPPSGEGRFVVYRSQAARRKVLLRLRNPDQAAQVRGLVAGLPGSVVLVTSRRPLGGLVTEDAVLLDLTVSGPSSWARGKVYHVPPAPPAA